jgi:ubiquinone/menaquinone biosynthesis C-methylase UbiE
MQKMSFHEKLFVNSRYMKFSHRFFGINRILNKIDANPKEILELGCGNGITTGFIVKKFPKARIVALDYDKDQIEIAKRKKVDNVEFIVGDASDLKFKDETFDMVIESLAFHHVKDYKKAIQETYRVLRKDGQFIVFDIATRAIPFFHWIEKHPTYFSKNEFVDELKGVGFKILKHGGRFKFWVHAVK